uniref:ADP-ribosylation factor-like protein 2 isoform X1 n=2 Tax=Cercopithecinae TaxID=9528 RepID=UPI0003ABC167|nr:PREDICTED: ADP-ribosylation factor-like protein 2 isoform X1 [Macaca fascicularis]XP_014969309.2 ADP-ribosylation factor-like protein 2 isoform X1 [Macaca mulatta]
MPSASVIANRNRERGPGTGKKRRPGGAPGTMGLLTILKKMKQKERELRLLMLGLDNAGKTTILKKFNGEDIDTISPTLGFNIKTLEHRGFKLNIWDVGGQKSLRSYWRNYFESTDGLIWVVDSADHQRMQDCQRELQSLLVEEVGSSYPLCKCVDMWPPSQQMPRGVRGPRGKLEAGSIPSLGPHHGRPMVPEAGHMLWTEIELTSLGCYYVNTLSISFCALKW